MWDHIKLTIGCVGIGPKAGEGKQQGGSGKNKHGKMERRRDKGASHMQAGLTEPCA